MKNFVQAGEVLSLTAPYAVSAGDGFQVGAIFAVAVADAAHGAAVRGATCGVFTLTKETGAGWTAGQKIYWDDTNKRCTHTASTNKLVGYAIAAAASGDAVGNVWLPGL